MKNKKILVLVSALILVILFIVGLRVYKNQEAQKVEALVQENLSTFVRDYSPRLGSEKPEVILVEFLDPECESCRVFYPYVKSLMSEFEGKIQLVVRYAAFHGNSEFAIKIAEASRKQNKYWETLELLFQYQPQWGSHHDPKPELIWKYLPEAGVNVEQVKLDMMNPEIEKNLQQDMADGQTLGVKMTPAFFINGKPLQEFGYDQLRQAIMDELNKL